MAINKRSKNTYCILKKESLVVAKRHNEVSKQIIIESVKDNLILVSNMKIILQGNLED